MAFHVACPITCKRICSCALGFPRAGSSDGAASRFWEEIAKVEEFLKDPSFLRVNDKGTIQIPVPKVVPPPPSVVVGSVGVEGAIAVVGDGAEELSAQTKRAALQKRAAEASLAAEDYARRFESGSLPDGPRDPCAEEQGLSNVNVMCRLCFSGENEGSLRAQRMLSCKSCSKKYHRSCVKTWSNNRDLFHWSSWTCPSCRLCEVCHRTGDPSKFKFCRRCDAAYHCYCMQPPHKNVSSGPYLCPNHTRCHSCGSNVPGNGLSVRWFLSYTCCDACGRLFTKGNYCPVCLRVYRDSEATPMVCCDICQRWVHCQCDEISDEKYLQFQADGNLPYTCPTCRGECYQVKDLEDAVRELWRRKDETDRDLIAELRSAAGLPSQDEIFSISPFSDDDDDGPFAKNEHGRAKISLKSLADNTVKKSKDHGKKSSSKKHVKKKEHEMCSGGDSDLKHNFEDQEAQPGQFAPSNGQDYVQSHRSGTDTSSPSRVLCSMKQQWIQKQKAISDVVDDAEKRPGVLRIESRTSSGENAGKAADKKPVKATKLVIHLGGRNRNVANSPMSDSSSYHREQESLPLNGGEAISGGRESDRYAAARTPNPDEGDRVGSSHEMKGHKNREREGNSNIIRLGKGKSEAIPKGDRGNSNSGNGVLSPAKAPLLLRKRSSEGHPTSGSQSVASKGERSSLRKHPDNRPGPAGIHIAESPTFSLPEASRKDPKPLLRLKFKNPYQGSWVSGGEEEKSSIKGQRSKRKRPSPKVKSHEDEDGSESQPDNISNEIMDANWVLRRLGKDAVGKRVEVHQRTSNSWHKGVVSDLIEGTSILSVDLDDGRTRTVELGKQGIRFVPQKNKKLKY